MAIRIPMILFDTCSLLWLAADHSKLGKAAIAAWGTAGDHRYFSSISLFEIGQKQAAGKLALSQSLSAWTRELNTLFALEEIPLTSAICIAAAALPPIHKDPFDRLIIATALTRQLTILTCDETIARYPGVNTLW